MNTQMKQTSVAQSAQLLKSWLCGLQSGMAVQKNWALSVDQYGLQAALGTSDQFAEHTSQM